MGQFLSLVLCFMTFINHYINTGSYKLSLPTGNLFVRKDCFLPLASEVKLTELQQFQVRNFAPLINYYRFCETGQNVPHYAMMCLVYTTWLSCRGVGNGLISVIRARGWRYLLLALIDVEACTLITSSHQYTSLASIQVCKYAIIILRT